LQGLIPAASVYLTRPLVNQLFSIAREGADWNSIRPLATLAGLFAGLAVLSEIVERAVTWLRTRQSELVQDYIAGLIHKKSSEVDLAFYDSPEFYDRLHRAREEASYRPVLLLESLSGLVQAAVTLCVVLVFIARYGAWLSVGLIFSTLPALFVVLLHSVRQHEWRLRNTESERRSWYYQWLLTSQEAATELRVFALGCRFQSAYESLRERLRGEKLDLAKRQALAEFAAGALALLVTGASLLWIGWKAVRGWISMGDLALFYRSFEQGLGLMRVSLHNLGQLYANSLFLGNLFEFLALRPTVLAPRSPLPVPKPLRVGIRFENVSFQYPGARGPVLKNFNLTIPAGKIISIVGPNGAGKSTFVKLLCRLYDPTEGRIEFDGVDLREFSLEELRRAVTALFQEPVHYNATALENIRMAQAEAPRSKVEWAAQAGGADSIIERLPGGYDTLLGQAFLKGTQLSTGEWQRVALARAFLHPAPVLILDEPTSAMDPWAEADWVNRFRSLAAGRTAILITHRLTTAMRADEIFVLSQGRLVESGTHADLLAERGLYAESWALHASAGESPMTRQKTS
jgi:ATP-binding cassette subfamily B protein